MERIKILRRQKSLTMKELGEIVGVSESTISLYENKKRQPDNDTLVKLADALNCSVDYLLGRSDTFNDNSLSITEKQLLKQYRAHPEMHEAVHRILGIEEAVPGFRLVAYGGDNVDNDAPTEPRIT